MPEDTNPNQPIPPKPMPGESVPENPPVPQPPVPDEPVNVPPPNPAPTPSPKPPVSSWLNSIPTQPTSPPIPENPLPAPTEPPAPPPVSNDSPGEFKLAGPSQEIDLPSNEPGPNPSPYPEDLPVPKIPQVKDSFSNQTSFAAPPEILTAVRPNRLPLIIGIVVLAGVVAIGFFLFFGNLASRGNNNKEVGVENAPPKIVPVEEKTPAADSAFGQILNATPSGR